MAQSNDYVENRKVTLTNKGKEAVGFRYFRVNFTEVLQPTDSVILTAGSSEEVAYYKALADATIGLEVKAEKASASA